MKYTLNQRKLNTLLTFDPGLALTGFQTTRTSRIHFCHACQQVIQTAVLNCINNKQVLKRRTGGFKDSVGL